MLLKETTFNRPSIVWAVGYSWVAFAGTGENGEVNVVKLGADPSSTEQAKWTLPGSSTYTGAGASIGYNHSFGYPVVAWTNGEGAVC